jgi:hypothetical protein
MWSQVTRGPRYQGGFTGRAFALVENTTGVDSELDLQDDCAAIEEALKYA